MNIRPLQVNREHMDKITAYFDCIEEHFLKPAGSEQVSSSCTATCLLLFPVFDALGFLFSESENPGNRVRFEWTLSELSGGYEASKEELWKLRNSLIHEALFDSACLSQVQNWPHKHLDKTNDGMLLINTRTLTEDLCRLVSRLRCETKCCSDRTMRADSRLDWGMKNYSPPSDTTPPPPIIVRYLRKK